MPQIAQIIANYRKKLHHSEGHSRLFALICGLNKTLLGKTSINHHSPARMKSMRLRIAA